MSQMVDLIMGTTYADHDVNISPVIALECGHIFTTETLDGITEIQKYYECEETLTTDGETEVRWIAPADVDDNLVGVPPTCPTCRPPIRNVRRYGRPVAMTGLKMLERKQLLQTQHRIREISTPTTTTVRPTDADASVKRRYQALESLCKSIKLQGGPSTRVQQAMVATSAMIATSAEASARGGGFGNAMVVGMRRSTSQVLFQVVLPMVEAALALSDTGPPAGAVARTATSTSGGKQFSKLLPFVEAVVIDAIGKAAAELSLQTVAKLQLALVRLRLKHFNGRTIPGEEKAGLLARVDSVINSTSAAIPNALKDTAVTLRIVVLTNGELTEQDRIDINAAMGGGYDYGSSSHWFACPNGHAYYIGECGGAMQRSTCPECGAAIGGASYQLAQNNTATDFVNQR
jgi:hypothetical protein